MKRKNKSIYRKLARNTRFEFQQRTIVEEYLRVKSAIIIFRATAFVLEKKRKSPIYRRKIICPSSSHVLPVKKERKKQKKKERIASSAKRHSCDIPSHERRFIDRPASAIGSIID